MKCLFIHSFPFCYFSWPSRQGLHVACMNLKSGLLHTGSPLPPLSNCEVCSYIIFSPQTSPAFQSKYPALLFSKTPSLQFLKKIAENCRFISIFTPRFGTGVTLRLSFKLTRITPFAQNWPTHLHRDGSLLTVTCHLNLTVCHGGLVSRSRYNNYSSNPRAPGEGPMEPRGSGVCH